MKKINLNLLAISVILILLTACKKPKTEDTITFTVTAEALNNGKTEIDGLGNINWESDDKIYTITGWSMGAYFNILTQNSGGSGGDEELKNEDGYATFSGRIGYGDEPYDYSTVDFIHFRNYTSHMYDSPQNVKVHINKQEGTQEKIGEYVISKAPESKATKINYTYQFSNVKFKPYTSVARFNLSQYEDIAIKISYENINNCYMASYVPWFDNQINEEGTNGEITILYPSADTYVALLPQIYKPGTHETFSMAPIENTIITFTNAITNEVIGTVTFPNGVKNGRLYTGPDYKPIKIGKRSTVVETEL